MTIRSEDNRGVVRNRAEFWKFFSPSQILEGGPPENGTHIITPALRHVNWKKFREHTPTIPEVIVAHMLNFRPNFKFSRLIFLFFWGGGQGGPPSQLECALGIAWVNL